MRLEVILAGHAQRMPDKIALRSGDRELSYRELHRSVQRVARGLQALGVVPGDRVLLYLPNGLEFVQAMYGALTLGAIVVPVNTRLVARELSHFVEDSQPRAVVFHSDLAGVIADVPTLPAATARVAVGAPVAGARGFDELQRIESDEPLPDVSQGSDDCMILYTSGTTGKPKGAVITHANVVVTHGWLNAIHWGVSDQDRYLVTTPMAHRTGLGRLMNALCLGGTLIALPKFEPQAVVDAIEKEGITVLGMVPTVARMLLPVLREQAGRCASLRRIIVTGEAFPVSLKQELIALLPQVRLCSFFAMTEAGSVTALNHEEQFTHPESVGRVMPGVEVKLVDEQGETVPTGEVGELLIRSGPPGRYSTMRCYYNLPDETAKTIRNGWVHTGDMGRFDEDGYLYIVDRKKDMVLSGGFNIYTKEVERTLMDHPAVSEAAVIGVPDPVYGEAVVAFVEPVPGTCPSSEELIEHCRANMAGYKKPREIHFVDALPRNPLGKVLKNELRARVTMGASA